MAEYYFAYGSNMNAKRMDEREAFYTSRIKGKLSGYRLVFNKRARQPLSGAGAANIIPDPDSSVYGVLYEVEAAGLVKLDGFEGAPCHYRREYVPIQCENGRVITAVTYIAQPEMVAEGLKPTCEYLKHLLAGKDLLPDFYVQQLQAVKTLD